MICRQFAGVKPHTIASRKVIIIIETPHSTIIASHGHGQTQNMTGIPHFSTLSPHTSPASSIHNNNEHIKIVPSKVIASEEDLLQVQIERCIVSSLERKPTSSGSSMETKQALRVADLSQFSPEAGYFLFKSKIVASGDVLGLEQREAFSLKVMNRGKDPQQSSKNL